MEQLRRGKLRDHSATPTTATNVRNKMFSRQSLPAFSAALTKRFPEEFTPTHTMIQEVMAHLFAMCGGLPHGVTESDIETANVACYVLIYPEAGAPFFYDPNDVKSRETLLRQYG
jgi:hypothetical protein